jgi:hypothetical protein
VFAIVLVTFVTYALTAAGGWQRHNFIVPRPWQLVVASLYCFAHNLVVEHVQLPPSRRYFKPAVTHSDWLTDMDWPPKTLAITRDAFEE